jgi:hypothetical protein
MVVGEKMANKAAKEQKAEMPPSIGMQRYVCRTAHITFGLIKEGWATGSQRRRVSHVGEI